MRSARAIDGVDVAEGLGQEHELVAAEPGHRVAGRRPRCSRARDRTALVADDVAERVVDLLEPVEVEKQHGDVGPASLCRPRSAADRRTTKIGGWRAR